MNLFETALACADVLRAARVAESATLAMYEVARERYLACGGVAGERYLVQSAPILENARRVFNLCGEAYLAAYDVRCRAEIVARDTARDTARYVGR